MALAPVVLILTLAIVGWFGSARPSVALEDLGAEGKRLCVAIYAVVTVLASAWLVGFAF
jgi:hypothetical protein